MIGKKPHVAMRPAAEAKSPAHAASECYQPIGLG